MQVAVRFLTEEWAQKMSEAAGTNDEVKQATKGQQVVMQIEVTGSPDLQHYYIEFNDGSMAFRPGTADSPDLNAQVSYETNLALSKGELTGQTASMTGKMKVTGDMMKMMNVGKALDHWPTLAHDIGTEY